MILNIACIYNARGFCYFQIANIAMLSFHIKHLSDSMKGLKSLKNRYNKPSEFIENINNAIADYTKAIELEPDNFSYYKNRGNCYKLNDEYNLAIIDYKRAIELTTDDSEIKEMEELIEEISQDFNKENRTINVSSFHYNPAQGRKLDL